MAETLEARKLRMAKARAGMAVALAPRVEHLERSLDGLQQAVLDLQMNTVKSPSMKAAPADDIADLSRRLLALEQNVAGLRRRLDTHNVNVHQIAPNR